MVRPARSPRHVVLLIGLLSCACAGARAGENNGSNAAPIRVRGSATGPTESDPATASLASGPGDETAEILRATEGYEAWTLFDRFSDGPEQSLGHGNMWVTARYNDVAANAIEGGADDFPRDSVIVKENRKEPGGPVAVLTSMVKTSGGWYWIEHTPDGDVVEGDDGPIAGEVDACIGCHNAAPTDMVFSGSQ